MNLSEDSVKKLDLLMQTASTANIDKMIIDKDMIRGVDEKKTVVLLSSENIPDFGGLTVGLNRLNALSNRLNLIKNDKEFSLEYFEAERNKGEISHVQLNTKSTKVQFKCAHTELIKGIPKALNDKEFWLINIPVEAISLLGNAVSAMGSEEIVLIKKANGELFFECIDVNNDVFSNNFSNKCEWIPTDISDPITKTFTHRYPAKTLLSLLKATIEKDTKEIFAIVGEKGVLQIKLNGFSLMIIPMT